MIVVVNHIDGINYITYKGHNIFKAKKLVETFNTYYYDIGYSNLYKINSRYFKTFKNKVDELNNKYMSRRY